MDHPEGPHQPTGNQDHSEEKEENEVPDEPSTGWSWGKTPAAQPHQRNSEPDQRSCTGQRLHLVGTFLRELPQLLQLLGMWGHAPVSNAPDSTHRTVHTGLPWCVMGTDSTPLWGLYTTVFLLRATERNFPLSHQS